MRAGHLCAFTDLARFDEGDVHKLLDHKQFIHLGPRKAHYLHHPTNNMHVCLCHPTKMHVCVSTFIRFFLVAQIMAEAATYWEAMLRKVLQGP